jgi:hypothetical protein
MKHLQSIAALAACGLLAACADYATFVTATNIGISADTKTQDLSIGYTRAELFIGPGYPEQGEAPRAVGFINSNLSVFQPHIQQVYATGDAAELVTTTTTPGPAKEPEYYGQRRPLVFGTGANVGLKIGFGAETAAVPSSIKLGYNREEVSIIPMRREQPTPTSQDRYAPVLASMDMNLEATTQADTKFGITQFFATGSAARNLAVRSDIRAHFRDQAASAVKTALSGTYSYDDTSKKIEAFWMPDGKTINQVNAKRIISCMNISKIEGSIPFLINARSKPERDAVITCLQI